MPIPQQEYVLQSALNGLIHLVTTISQAGKGYVFSNAQMDIMRNLFTEHAA